MNDQEYQETTVVVEAEPEDTDSHSGRKWVVGILILVGAFLLVFANVAFWAYFTLLNTHGWVAAVGPLSKDPEVASLTSQYVVDNLFAQADIQELAQEALPPKYQVLAGPLVTGMEEVADEAANRVIISDGFNNIWVAFNRISHEAVMDVLNGRGNRLYFEDGNLTLDLSNLYNFVQTRLRLGADVNLIPQAEGGRLVLLSSEQVAVMQEAVSYLRTLGILLPLLTILAFVVAWLISLWRRHTVMWIGVAMIITMLISLIFFAGARSSMVTSIEDPFLRELGRAIIQVLTHGLIVQTIVLFILGIVLVIIGWQAAPDSAVRQWEASRREGQEMAGS